MTDPTPADGDQAKGGAKRASRRRQVVGIWVGAGLGVLVIVAVLLTTLASGGGDGGTTTTAAPPSNANPVPTGIVVTGTVVTPDGDYTEFCKRLTNQASAVTATPGTPEQLSQLAKTIDFASLEEVAPDGLLPSLRTLASQRDEVVALFDQLDDFSEVTNADFPAGFLDAVHVMTQATEEKCP
ncbi:MAG TPA: hypothetical protein VNQ33_03185 [Acidimicrobiales bacterium]|nr:hypothetical protein [Acidimicrobiales bacterium]